MARGPLIVESAYAKDLDDATIATMADVDVAVVTACRAGVPYWPIKKRKRIDRLAAALGTTREALQAGFDRAAQEMLGRNPNGFGSTDGFRRMRS